MEISRGTHESEMRFVEENKGRGEGATLNFNISYSCEKR